MDFSFTDEQNELRELARKILGDFATNERLKDVESRQPIFDAELWRELGRSNLLGLAIEDGHGGSDFGWFELCLLLQEIGRSVAPVPVYASLVLGALPLSAFGTTLEELADADLLLHVVDAADPRIQARIEAVEGLLERLDLALLPRMLILNKSDLVSDEQMEHFTRRYEGVPVSATKKRGMEDLVAAAERMLGRPVATASARA